MTKSKISPEQKARRAQLGELMAGAGIKNMEDMRVLECQQVFGQKR